MVLKTIMMVAGQAARVSLAPSWRSVAPQPPPGVAGVTVLARAECWVRLASVTDDQTLPTQSPAAAPGQSVGWAHLLPGDRLTAGDDDWSRPLEPIAAVLVWPVVTGELVITGHW